nr:immunoglobulin heavy chain junction region [Mus musculus]
CARSGDYDVDFDYW